MKLGMMWQDTSTADMADKVREAARYYVTKYGKAATLAFVNPTQHSVDAVDGVKVKPSRSVRPNHIWLGVEDE